MARKFFVPIDLTNNELQNALLQNVATASLPSTNRAGQILYDSTVNLPAWNNASGFQYIYKMVSANTPTTAVLRDSSGNFSAGTITASLSGTASLAISMSGGSAGGLPYQTAPGSTSFLGIGTANLALISNGSVPTWGQVSLTAGVTGTLPIANGGTGLTSTSQNFVFIGPTSGAGAPTWRALVAGDIPSLSATYLSLSGGTLTGGLLGTTGNFSGSMTASSFTGAGTGLTGTAASLNIGGNAATATLASSATVAANATVLSTARSFSITGKATASGVSFDGSGAVALNVTALSVAVGDISLTSGYFLIGAAGVGSAVAKTAIPLSGFGAAGADLALGGFKITGMADPTQPQDAATKAYVDATAQGLSVKAACNYATTAALPSCTYSGGGLTLTASSNGALTVDSAGLTSGNVGNRILVKNQVAGQQNGLYVVTQAGDSGTPFILTRASDFNTSAKILTGSFAFIEFGTLNANTGWSLTTPPTIVMDTTSLTFAQFSGAGTYSSGNGIVLVGTQFHFATSSPYVVGDMYYANSTNSLATLTAVATGNALISGGTGTAPSWGKISLTAHVSGTLPIGSGGTNATTITPNGVAYGGASAYAFTGVGTPAQILMANSSNVPTFVTVSGDITLTSAGVSAIGANKVLYSMIQGVAATSIIGNPTASSATPQAISASADGQVLRQSGTTLSWGAITLSNANSVTGTLGAANGGTGQSSYSIGDILYASGASALSRLAAVAVGSALISAGTGTAPAWGKIDLTAAVSGILPSANGGTGIAYFTAAGPTVARTFTFKDQNGNIPLHKTATFTGDNTTTTFSATHSLNTTNVQAFLYDAGNNQVEADVLTFDANTVKFSFSVAPTNVTTYRWVIIGY